MMHPVLVLLSAMRAVIEVALLALLAQGVLGLLAGARRSTNPVYRLFEILTRPVLAATRWLAPRQIIDRHLPYLAVFILFWVWIGLAYLKRIYCTANALQCF